MKSRNKILLVLIPALAILGCKSVTPRTYTTKVGLEWFYPKDKTDDLAGFIISYGLKTHTYSSNQFAVNTPYSVQGSDYVYRYDVMGLLDNTTWYFAVQATNIHGFLSEFSNEAVYSVTNIAVPSTPTQLAYSYPTNTTVFLTWDYPTMYIGGLADFKALWGTVSGNYYYDKSTALNSTGSHSNMTTYGTQIIDLAYGQTYYFVIKAYGTNGLVSEASNEIIYTLASTNITSTVTITPRWTTNLNGGWSNVPAWPSMTITNPVNDLFFMFDIRKQ